MKVLNAGQRAQLTQLIKTQSKHSDYQFLHPLLTNALDLDYKPAGKHETPRQIYMQTHMPVTGKSVLDIGANTGFFSLAALQAGAASVLCVEGNLQHAQFMQACAHILNLSDRMEIQNRYYDFTQQTKNHFDVTLCLNVLHHLGDDFGNPELAREEAKLQMIQALNHLASQTNALWFQLGFNWKGDRHAPLFEEGLKSELIDFVTRNTSDHWSVRKISVVDPETLAYVDAEGDMLQRFDSLGEFLNRPLFLMESKHV